MQNRGKIIQKAIQQSGYSITKLAVDLSKSRSWLYQLFENEKAPFGIIKKIGDHINYDFSKEIDDYYISESNLNQQKENSSLKSAEYWKDKYIILLEEYTVLIKKSL